MYELAEAVFAFIDEISAASAEGHAFEQSLAAGELRDRRRQLVDTLLTDPQSPPEEVEHAARAAGWSVPARLAVLVVDRAGAERVAARLPAPVVVAGDCAIVPDPDGPGRHDELRRALRDARGALGPTVPASEAVESERRARLAFEHLTADGPLVLADAHLLDLMLLRDPRLAGDLARSRLAPLDDLPASQRDRLLETLRAWLDAHGEARPAAERLHVHVQTVRYRLGQLEDLLGDALSDPDCRLELELALRVVAPAVDGGRSSAV
jgi:hypothetical protein